MKKNTKSFSGNIFNDSSTLPIQSDVESRRYQHSTDAKSSNERGTKRKTTDRSFKERSSRSCNLFSKISIFKSNRRRSLEKAKKWEYPANDLIVNCSNNLPSNDPFNINSPLKFSPSVLESSRSILNEKLDSDFHSRLNITKDKQPHLSGTSAYKKKWDKNKRAFHMRNTMLHDDVIKISSNKNIKVNITDAKRATSERDENSNILKSVHLLRYRENVYKAAAKISMDVPPFPIWSFKRKSEKNQKIVTINVGGKKFQILSDTLMNIPHSKLRNAYVSHCEQAVMYFDRDAACFSYVINFFRTGRLHAPTNSCLSFFEEELSFWGINEDLMEPCCYSEYMAYKKTFYTLKRYGDLRNEPQNPSKAFRSSCSSIKQKIYVILTSSDSGSLARWYSLICGIAIILSIIIMLTSTSIDGRIDRQTQKYSARAENESLTHFFGRTDPNPSINTLETVLVGFFVADFLVRFLLAPNRLVFYADTINWVDFIATISSLLSQLSRNKYQPGQYETYILLMKVPRVFRLFRLTRNLRLGTEAFVLTLRARLSELRLVLILTIISICVFGALIYVVELVNERLQHRISQFKSVYDGMWFAIVTMATVGYGDITPVSTGGYVIGFFCILTGIIISQLPVPIFLNKFSDFYTEIQSRQRNVNKVLNQNIDPENFVINGSIRRTLEEVFNQEDIAKIKGFSLPH